jgi:hypothetical protein
MSDINQTLTEKQALYGDFSKAAGISQDIKIIMSQSSRWMDLNPGQRESLEMIANRIGQILSGGASWLLNETAKIAAVELARLRREAEDNASVAVILRAENDRLRALINNPHTDDFLAAVRLEAAHQQERWGSEHDAGKTDADWFWLVGYLAGKAITKPEKQLHHIITTAAALLNWHAHKTGASTGMRPGILPPDEPGAGGRP